MEIGSTVKVQLVRCPNCRLLVPEPADVLVYKCGGCSTDLQVKIRMNDAKSPVIHGTDTAQMNESDHVDVRDSTNSNQKASPPSLKRAFFGPKHWKGSRYIQ